MKFSVIASIVGSLVLGVAALLVARFWLPAQAEKNQAAVPGLVDTSLQPVVVARSGLAYGTTLDAGKLIIKRMPADAIPAGAFSTIEQVLAHDGEKGVPVVLVPIAEREAILPTKISGPGSRPSVATQIGAGMRAYAIGVQDVSGVGGNILPGDWVDVVLARETNEDRLDKGMVSEIVLQNVRVLGLDLNSDPTSTEATVPDTATLEVKIEDVQKLAVAGQLGNLSLALRRTGSAELARVRPIRSTDVSTVTVGGPAPVAKAQVRTVSAPAGRPILIVAGAQSTTVHVPADRGTFR